MSVCSLSLPYQRNLHLIDLFRTHIVRLPIRISDQPAYYQPVIEGSEQSNFTFVRVMVSRISGGNCVFFLSFPPSIPLTDL